jgi:serine/threonine protein kinase
MSQPTAYGKYQLLVKLATGGLADLYQAQTRLANGRDLAVVIKRLRPEVVANPEFAAMFVDEARIAAALDHPNIARIYEWGRVEHSYFIAMEYIEGTNLGSLMQSLAEQRERFPPTLSLYVMSEVLAGLSFAHNLKDPFGNVLGIVHGGICPPNIVISARGAVKLVDFGLARAVFRRHKNIPAQFAYQFTYFAPEAIGEHEVDARADLFSCGVVLYELLTGQKLHSLGRSEQRQTLIETVNAHPPSSVFTDIPAELDRVVQSCLGEDPVDRPPSADALRATLTAFLQHWDHTANAETLSALLLDTFSGRAHHKGGFSFGEATSQWLAQGDELQRMTPDETPENQVALAPPVTEEPISPDAEAAVPALIGKLDSRAPEYQAPRQSFASGDTVMAIEEGGLGKKRQQTTLLRMGGIVAALILLVGLIIYWLVKDTGETAPISAGPSTNRFAGAVNVNVTPEGALIFVDGDPVKPEGNPPQLLNLRPGQHRIKLMYPGYLFWEGDIVLEADQPSAIERVLEERTGKLVITSVPPGANLIQDGSRLLGKTPYTIDQYLVRKTMKVVLDLKGYQVVRVTVEPSDWPEDPGAELKIEKKLEKKIEKKKIEKNIAKKPQRAPASRRRR